MSEMEMNKLWSCAAQTGFVENGHVEVAEKPPTNLEGRYARAIEMQRALRAV